MRTLVLAALLLAVPLAGAFPTLPEEPARLVVPLAAVEPGRLDAAAARTGAVVVRTDAVLGFAVVQAPAPLAFEAALGSAVLRDARGEGGTQAGPVDPPLDALFPAQWGPIEMAMPLAWGTQDGNAGIVVGVVDSGINAFHLDFAGVPITMGWDYVQGDANPQDGHGHGTHVAGIIAAARDNVHGIAGMARVTLHVVRVLDNFNAGWCSDFASGIAAAADAGAHVINFSIWCAGHFQPLRDAIVYAQSTKGALVVTISGNFQQGGPAPCVTYPGAYPEPLTVAAIRPTLQPAPFSCQGAAVDLAAPGENIVSTVLGQLYLPMSGTSMAAPHVAGAAALVKAQNPSLTMAQVRSVLETTARDLGAPGHDPGTGYGLVDPVAALASV